MKSSICLAAVLAMAGVASAAPIVSSSVTELGGGLFGTTVSVSDGVSTGSWAMDWTFTGTGGAEISQAGAFGGAVVIKTEADANLYSGMPAAGYTKALDSWVYAPFGPVATGITEGANNYHAVIGSGPGNFGAVPVMYIVSTEGALAYSGTIGRGGSSFNVSDSITVAIPEPVSLSALGLGAIATLRRRRHS